MQYHVRSMIALAMFLSTVAFVMFWLLSFFVSTWLTILAIPMTLYWLWLWREAFRDWNCGR